MTTLHLRILGDSPNFLPGSAVSVEVVNEDGDAVGELFVTEWGVQGSADGTPAKVSFTMNARNVDIGSR